MSRTKIVATIGPVTNNRDSLIALAEAGMNIARLNGSHGSLDRHAETVRLLRDTLPEVPILFDIPGRKVRTMTLAVEPSFDEGDTVLFTTDTRHDGREKVPVNYPYLHEILVPGNTILADDGSLEFTVVGVEGQDIVCRAECSGTLRSGKSINVPSVNFAVDLLTQRDREMVAFARDQAIDFVGISFVESAAQAEAVRSLVGANSPRTISKIESQKGLDNLLEIIDATDAVMVDRGDLSVETNLPSLALFQKRIVKAARDAGKPAIVATEMLHTMIKNRAPTKAEVSDITNAVLDGCSALMLSGETAIGDFPVEAVSVMRQIADAAEAHVQVTLGSDHESTEHGVPRVMGLVIAQICRTLPITKIVVVTRSGYAARMIASHRPSQPILAASDDAIAARSFNLFAGTEGVFVDVPFSRSSTDHIVACVEELWRRGYLDEDDLILINAVGYPKSGNRMNLLQTHCVRDLMETLGWSPR